MRSISDFETYDDYFHSFENNPLLVTLNHHQFLWHLQQLEGEVTSSVKVSELLPHTERKHYIRYSNLSSSELNAFKMHPASEYDTFLSLVSCEDPRIIFINPIVLVKTIIDRALQLFIECKKQPYLLPFGTKKSIFSIKKDANEVNLQQYLRTEYLPISFIGLRLFAKISITAPAFQDTIFSCYFPPLCDLCFSFNSAFSKFRRNVDEYGEVFLSFPLKEKLTHLPKLISLPKCVCIPPVNIDLLCNHNYDFIDAQSFLSTMKVDHDIDFWEGIDTPGLVEMVESIDFTESLTRESQLTFLADNLNVIYSNKLANIIPIPKKVASNTIIKVKKERTQKVKVKKPTKAEKLAERNRIQTKHDNESAYPRGTPGEHKTKDKGKNKKLKPIPGTKNEATDHDAFSPFEDPKLNKK